MLSVASEVENYNEHTDLWDSVNFSSWKIPATVKNNGNEKHSAIWYSLDGIINSWVMMYYIQPLKLVTNA